MLSFFFCWHQCCQIWSLLPSPQFLDQAFPDRSLTGTTALPTSPSHKHRQRGAKILRKREKKPNRIWLKGRNGSKYPAFCKGYPVPRQHRDGSGRGVGIQPESSCPHAGVSTSSGITAAQIPSLPQILQVLLMRFKIKRHCQEHLVPPGRHCWGWLAQPVLHSSAQGTNLAVSLSHPF